MIMIRIEHLLIEIIYKKYLSCNSLVIIIAIDLAMTDD